MIVECFKSLNPEYLKALGLIVAIVLAIWIHERFIREEDNFRWRG